MHFLLTFLKNCGVKIEKISDSFQLLLVLAFRPVNFSFSGDYLVRHDLKTVLKEFL
jgi:hypothetical protein